MAKKRIISRLVAGAILVSLNFIERRFINNLPGDDIRATLKLLLVPIRGMVNALSDGDPRNAEQVRELFKKFTNKDVSDFVDDKIIEIANKIAHEDGKKVVLHFALKSTNVIRLFTDEDPDNKRQLTLWLKDLYDDPDTHEIVFGNLLEPALEKHLDEETVDFIISLIRQALQNGEEENESGKLLKSMPARGITIQLNRK